MRLSQPTHCFMGRLQDVELRGERLLTDGLTATGSGVCCGTRAGYSTPEMRLRTILGVLPATPRVSGRIVSRVLPPCKLESFGNITTRANIAQWSSLEFRCGSHVGETDREGANATLPSWRCCGWREGPGQGGLPLGCSGTFVWAAVRLRTTMPPETTARPGMHAIEGLRAKGPSLGFSSIIRGNNRSARTICCSLQLASFGRWQRSLFGRCIGVYESESSRLGGFFWVAETSSDLEFSVLPRRKAQRSS